MKQPTLKPRPSTALQPIPLNKRPYVVRGMPRTILYMTSEHAAKRFDLIPQFAGGAVAPALGPTMTIIFNYLFTSVDDYFICRVTLRILSGPVLTEGQIPSLLDSSGIDLHVWTGRSLNVRIWEGIHQITGLTA